MWFISSFFEDYLAGVFMINNLFNSFQPYLKDNIEVCGGNSKEVELPFDVGLIMHTSNITHTSAELYIDSTIFLYADVKTSVRNFGFTIHGVHYSRGTYFVRIFSCLFSFLKKTSHNLFFTVLHLSSFL